MEGGWSDGLIGPGQPVLDPVPSREPVEMLLVEKQNNLPPICLDGWQNAPMSPALIIIDMQRGMRSKAAGP